MANNNENKILNVPNLRFTEFTEEWEKCTLGDITINFNLRNKDKIEFPMYSVTNNRGFIPQSEQFEDRDMVGEDIKAYKIIHNKDFAYNPARINVGSIAKYSGSEPCMISSLYVCFKAANGIDEDWLMHLLRSPKIQYYYQTNGEGGVRIYLFYPNFARIRTSLPTITEQRKIANLLSLLDERIATQNKIIDKLQSLISGIIQNAIQKGLNNNTWEMIYLSKLLTERKEKNSNGYEVNSVSVSEGVINQIEYLGRSFAASDTSKYNVVRYGDIVYTKSPTGNFPYGIIKQSFQKHPVVVSPLYGVYEPYSNEAGCFLHYYFLSSIVTTNYLSPLIQKGAKNTINISNQTFLNNMVPYPKEEVGIRPIAELLRNVQIKLNIERLSLVLLEQQKTYLLRSMFI